MGDRAALLDRGRWPCAAAMGAGRVHRPRRGDWPVVFCIAILHLVAFSALVAVGLQFVPAGRAIVLGYTTPLWVAIGAAIFLSEAITRRRAAGMVFGLAGLAVIFNPQTLNWSDRNALYRQRPDPARGVLLGRQHRLRQGAQMDFDAVSAGVLAGAFGGRAALVYRPCR